MFDTDHIETETTGNTDSLGAYLMEIGRHPLLSREEEILLAGRVAAGDRAARQRLIESNLRLVVTIARGYQRGGVDLLDLIQEGTMGLMRAVDRYDGEKGRFGTYASWWIRAGIMDALSASSTSIRIPESMRTRLRDVQRAERDLTAELGRYPEPFEIADRLELSVDQVAEARAAALPVGSLDISFGADGDLQQAELLADPHAVDPLQSVLDDADHAELDARLERLSSRGRQVIELRFGVRDGITRTADAVAAELDVARERVRQIELTALRQLAA
jgi:RNA polymerase sigma factor (sigma-70 family)